MGYSASSSRRNGSKFKLSQKVEKLYRGPWDNNKTKGCMKKSSALVGGFILNIDGSSKGNLDPLGLGDTTTND